MDGLKPCVNIMGSEKEVTLIIREGAALKVLDPLAPVKVVLAGVIGSPCEWLSKRVLELDQVDQVRCHVIVDREKVSIMLITGEDDNYTRGSIKGTLTQHPKFLEFGINDTNKSWSSNELGQFFKMNRAFFVDLSENMKLVTELKSFSAKVAVEIDRQKLDTGDMKDNYSQVVNSNLPAAFKLRIPIFKGVKADDLEVEFSTTVDGRAVIFQLYSPGAAQVFEEIRDKVIDEQLALIRALAPGIAIIEI